MPKVSIIIPCYRVEKYLDRCMESVVNQTLKDIEIILVDDGSPDRVPEICNTWKKKDSRVKVVHKQNAGLGFARNSGLDVATGEYIAFIDSDDYVDTTMFEALYNTADNGKFDIVYCGCKAQNRNGNFEDNYIYDDEFHGRNDMTKLMCDIIAGDDSHMTCTRMGSVWGAIFKHQIIKDNNLRFKSERVINSEDVVFDVDIYPYCQHVKYIPFSFYYYCYNETSLTKTFKEEKADRFFVLVDYMLKSSFGQTSPEFCKRVYREIILKAVTNSYMICSMGLCYHKTIELLNKYANREVWKQIQPVQIVNHWPKKYLLFSYLIKYKCTVLVYCISTLLSKIR